MHLNSCMSQNECQIEMPKENQNFVEFKKYRNQVVAPFVLYADVETLLKKPTDRFCKEKKEGERETTTAVQQHEVYSIGYYLKCSYDDTKSYYNANRGPDCIDWFISELKSISDRVSSIFNNIVPIKMTSNDEINFLRAGECHICEKKFMKHVDIIVRDHCHFTGEYRGAAHQDCNLQFRDYRTIPVAVFVMA